MSSNDKAEWDGCFNRREYIKVKARNEEISPEEIVTQLSSLRSIQTSSEAGLLSKINPFASSEPETPKFEFLALYHGTSDRLDLYYTTEQQFIDSLHNSILAAYPDSFKVRRVEFDLRQELLPSKRYEIAEFKEKFEDGDLLLDPESISAAPDIVSDRLLDDDGRIETTPTIENYDPIAIQWNGVGKRKRDWMTPIKHFSNLQDRLEESSRKPPLSKLIDAFADFDVPIAFQVVFERKKDWTKAARKRKKNLHLGRDTRKQKILYELGQLIHGPSEERRRELRRDHFDDVGETADVTTPDPVLNHGRQSLVDMKDPSDTFRANIRSVAIVTDDAEFDEVEQSMKTLSHSLGTLDGQYYNLGPKIQRDDSGLLRNKNNATKEYQRLVDQKLRTGSGKSRPDVVLNSDELANLVAIPSGNSLTEQGSNSLREEPESRDPLPKPDPDLSGLFSKSGMAIGYPFDERGNEENSPFYLPTEVLPTHYLRTGMTGSGKSKALINDVLTLHENTDGPTILIDPKGDGMAEEYKRCHYRRFGVDDLKDSVVHFPIPDVLPGFTFFNIKPALERGRRRVDAIQNKADHYDELLKLVMGAERYRESKVAPTIIKALIKALFDETHADDREGRESVNYYSHDDLERAAEEMQSIVQSNDEDEGSIPAVEDERLHRTLARHADSDPRDFATIMNAVFNRLDYIREDAHLRRIFDNTDQQFDFRDHLNDSKVIVFDLGELRDDASVIMTGLILTNLWDALQEHDQTKCTHDHDDLEECRRYAIRKGGDPNDPPCREAWDDDHLVNLIIDEAASVAVSDIMNKMLEQGRSFHLSVGLSIQYPGQMKDAGERVYRNVINNIGSMFIGKIDLDEDIAEAMAHEDMSPDKFSQRISNLPRGEWIAQLPSPKFKQAGPQPFSLSPLPIPEGHSESDDQLDDEEQRLVDKYSGDKGTRERYGIVHEDGEDGSFSLGSESQTGSAGNSDSSSEIEFDTTITETNTDNPPGHELPESVDSVEEGYRCNHCGNQFLRNRYEAAIACCEENEPRNSASETTDASDSTDPHSPEERSVPTREFGQSDLNGEPGSFDPELLDESVHVDSVEAMFRPFIDWNRSNVAAVAKAIVQNIPGSHEGLTQLALELLASRARDNDVKYSPGEELTSEHLETAIQKVEPANLDISTVDLVEDLSDWQQSESDASQTAWPDSTDEYSGWSEPQRATNQSSPYVSRAPSPIPAAARPIFSKETFFKTWSDPNARDARVAKRSSQNPPLTGLEKEFLSVLVEIMNNKRSIDRTESLRGIRDQYIEKSKHEPQAQLDVQKLIENGYLIKHKIGRGGKLSYTVTKEGRKACGSQLETGEGNGDIGDGMPHRYGADLCKSWLQQRDHIDNVKTFYSLGGSGEIADIIGWRSGTNGGKIEVVGEIEAGMSKTELRNHNPNGKSFDGWDRPGTNDYESLANDYQKMQRICEHNLAADDVEAIWVVRDRQIGKRVLQGLAARDQVPDILSELFEERNVAQFNSDILEQYDLKGMDSIYTFHEINEHL